MTRSAFRAGAALVVAIFAAHAAAADEITVICSGGFSTALRELAPQFERVSGHKLNLGWGPSLGTTHDAIPMRFQRGESMDVLIMVGAALGELAKEGKVVEGSRVDLARSLIGMVVRKGAPKPDISSVEALERTLLAAKSIAYSDSASGVYIEKEMIPRLGIAEQLKGKARMIPAEPVGKVVARGEAELGFQQLSELKAVEGIDIVGLIPGDAQKVTVFSAGISASSAQPEAAKSLLAWLTSDKARATITRTGLEPIY